MSKTSPEQQLETMIRNLSEKTGKSLPQWLKLLSGTSLAKHGEIVKWLKSEHTVSHGFANLIANRHLAAGGPSADPVDAQFAGAKAGLRPIYDSICALVKKFGSDVDVSPRKTYVTLRRSKQFAIVKASTKDRIDVGINLKGIKPSGRLEASGSFNAMVSHRVRITSKKDVNSELKRWLKAAYDAA